MVERDGPFIEKNFVMFFLDSTVWNEACVFYLSFIAWFGRKKLNMKPRLPGLFTTASFMFILIGEHDR